MEAFSSELPSSQRVSCPTLGLGPTSFLIPKNSFLTSPEAVKVNKKAL